MQEIRTLIDISVDLHLAKDTFCLRLSLHDVDTTCLDKFNQRGNLRSKITDL